MGTRSWQTQLLSVVCSQYGFTDFTISQELGLWGSHIRWQLRSPKGQLFLLKEKPPYISDDEFESQLCLHHHIQRQNGPVVQLLITMTNELSLVWANRHLALLTWVEGRHLYPQQLEDNVELGGVIARFQDAAKSFESNTGNWELPHNRHWTAPERWTHILAYTEYVRQALQEIEEKEKAVALHQIQDWIIRQGTILDAQELPEQFIHADADCFNCIQGHGDTYIVDLDEVHWGYRVTDLAYAAAYVGGMHHVREDARGHIATVWQWEKIQGVLQGFGKHSSLTEVERANFHRFLGLNLIRAFISSLDLDTTNSITIPDDLVEQLKMLAILLALLEQEPPALWRMLHLWK